MTHPDRMRASASVTPFTHTPHTSASWARDTWPPPPVPPRKPHTVGADAQWQLLARAWPTAGPPACTHTSSRWGKEGSRGPQVG